MTQERKPRAKPEEGERLTARIMAAVKRARQAKDWSAEQLAAEMAAVGVPWTRDTVVNLENARRKHIAVHEAIALAYVLDVQSPLDILVPEPTADHENFYPVTPTHTVAVAAARAWFLGQTGPLRGWAADTAGIPVLGELAERLRERLESGSWPPEIAQDLADDMMRMVTSALRVQDGDPDGTD